MPVVVGDRVLAVDAALALAHSLHRHTWLCVAAQRLHGAIATTKGQKVTQEKEWLMSCSWIHQNFWMGPCWKIKSHQGTLHLKSHTLHGSMFFFLQNPKQKKTKKNIQGCSAELSNNDFKTRQNQELEVAQHHWLQEVDLLISGPLLWRTVGVRGLYL